MFFLVGRYFYIFIMVQIFYAGWAIFVEASAWSKHMMFIHLFGFNLPIFMLIIAWIGKMPRWSYGHVIGLMGWVFVMYFTGNMRGNLPIMAALHPIMAMLLSMHSSVLVWKVGNFIFKKKERAV
ncbi:DUF6220 domain-containing protein [Lederbergia sp. NSJ-179]|uniref:DUF6220 domain-containing protein n=1 Tax=Lederbergia sp. NSJ-179 TaxID=2931402 RepID=UPI001FD5AC8A|nr:DUF6220 domain-containing protein [Lederbergia sp. NSJ-179]MCJ7840091.1 DUF6220 domain-containing protein [Lederbergia sp. NSJ-179]